MRPFKKIKDSEEEKARARVLAHFEDDPDNVFYSRQIEILFEHEYFHWVTNRALRRLVEEGRIRTEARQLSTGRRRPPVGVVARHRFRVSLALESPFPSVLQFVIHCCFLDSL